MRSGKVIKINRFFPSSKTCNSCGQIKSDLKLSDRVYKCDCGYSCDRDLNAAKNIHTVGLTGINACGDGSSGFKICADSETTVIEAGTKPEELFCSSVN